MKNFQEFLDERLQIDGFATEDVLACFLPLMRQVIDAHRCGKVAPLTGTADLHVAPSGIWFEEAQQQTPTERPDLLRRLQPRDNAAMEVIDEHRRIIKVDGQVSDSTNLLIGDRSMPVTAAVYYPGYVGWEDLAGHHDPLTDIFSLGMILASIACGLDFNESSDLRKFVEHRHGLFEINRQLHPVVARAIGRMTQLDRHRRPPDLAALCLGLENYRDQQVDFEFDLAQVEGFESKDLHGKQQVILSRLQERLFEISRRNRLLHFKASMQTVNLTHASVPLSFDVRSIRSDQILTYGESLHKQLIAETPLSLNQHLNFNEAIYLPGLLDRIGADARRDEKEFGFAQLRLVLCFLRWANLKEEPHERYDSPLVLLPVKLVKKKGVRDTYSLRPLSLQAEINPVVRHQFKQLYGIELPESIDLEKQHLGVLYDLLRSQIQASESAVELERIDRPQIDLVHDRARRRLDQYRRRARIAGKGVRTFLDLDYSYDAANYHPLGLKLYCDKVRSPETHLNRIIEQQPRPMRHVSPTDDRPMVEKKKSFYTIRDATAENPYHWQFDFCSVTLGNFKYRKMSLVRDYDALLGDSIANDAFDATFSLVPRPLEPDAPPLPPLAERFHVVPCDPTQAVSIARAKSGNSYIIQGPPGTGKSQTIANLIADFVARGKRVLFVCEKRAAIDVVYLRLRQQGLDTLCCLIHDSQADKKTFVMDLKRTYETYLDGGGQGLETARRHQQAVAEVQDALKPIQAFDAMMRKQTDGAESQESLRLGPLLRRLLQLPPEWPELSPLETERLPEMKHWVQYREVIDRLDAVLSDLRDDPVFCNHPLRLLATHLAQDERPLGAITEVLDSVKPLLETITAVGATHDLSDAQWSTFANARAIIAYCREIAPLGRCSWLAALDATSEQGRRFEQHEQQHDSAKEALASAREKTTAWKNKLPRAEMSDALEQARRFEQSVWSMFKPSWWRLRGVLKRSYDFDSHVVKPRWSQVIAWLDDEYRAVEAIEKTEDDLRRRFRLQIDVSSFFEQVDALQAATNQLPTELRSLRDRLMRDPKASETILAILDAANTLESADRLLSTVLDGYADIPFAALQQELATMDASLGELSDFLVALDELAKLPDELADAIRQMKINIRQLEAASADREIGRLYRKHRGLERFDEKAHSKLVERLGNAHDLWQAGNAEVVRDRAAEVFLRHVRSGGPATSDDEGTRRKQYDRGRRELEHEFGKTMRYKSIRDLVTGDSGRVVSDLKPVWLMSPLSVSDTLPIDSDHFDVVIFDEASQITLEEAVPSLFRAKQAIVVGDQMQLPPTDFFSTKRSDEEELWIEEDGELVEYDLDSNSFLNHAGRNLASTMLGWHYRSRSESLISFSNWAFYQGRLLTVPEEEVSVRERDELQVTAAEEGKTGADEALRRAVSFHFLEHGIYEKRRNRAEAEYIAQMVRQLLSSDAEVSIGIVAFSEAQQEEIEDALGRLGQQDSTFRDRLETERERERDGEFVGLLVKNLENIQGDERDLIILSVCYGPRPEGPLRMNFGPINKSGGEKRLNVAFSRAKHHMSVVSSIRWTEITNDYNDGANCLKNYLRYAEATSVGKDDVASDLLQSMMVWQTTDGDTADLVSDVVGDQLAEALRGCGWIVERGVGQSHFRCDLAVRREGDLRYRLAIVIDHAEYYQETDLIEREVLRPRLLQAFGWNVATVLTKDWCHDRSEVLERLVRQLEQAGEGQ